MEAALLIIINPKIKNNKKKYNNKNRTLILIMSLIRIAFSFFFSLLFFFFFIFFVRLACLLHLTVGTRAIFYQRRMIQARTSCQFHQHQNTLLLFDPPFSSLFFTPYRTSNGLGNSYF